MNSHLFFPCILLAAYTAAAQSPNYHVEIHNPAKFDSGEALKQSPGQDVASEHRPLLTLPRQSMGNNRPDGAMQSSAGPLVNTVGGPGFEGVAANGYAPADTNMAVGPNHIVQWVNINFAIYDKAGNLISGPKPGNAFWSGFGGPCETRNDGDPIIQYDVIADRWIASQFTASGPPYYQCLAVSQTGDPNGAYYRYAYAFNDGFPDYPKISVWKTAYFGSYNLFSSTSGGWIGPRICAYDRAAMLIGASAVQECFNPGSSYGSLGPSDIDGGSAFAPPSNTGYFVDYGNNTLALWRFTPDFVAPSNATLTGPISLPVASFSPACGGGTCIPQPNGQNLDSNANCMMYRLAYRNFGSYEAMVLNHSVTAGSSVGVRWYEIRNPLTNPTIYQQGTYAPDATYRWMGSAAMDRKGNIAIGYSASSSTSFPSIRYTGRETTDPLNVLQSEQIVYTSGGSQNNNLTRWGDYSAMRIDPKDDCTFWYTTMYIPYDGSFNWRTRMASFKFNSCGPATPDFSISASPSSGSVNAGGSTTYTVSTAALNGYSGTIGLSVSGLPTGASASFAPGSIAGTGTSTLTVATSATTPTGNFSLTITGTDGTISHSASVTLCVTIPDFGISTSPSSQTVVQGSPATYTVNVAGLNGFGGPVALSATGMPAGAQASFNPASINGSGSAILTVSTAATTSPGTYAVTITGASGSLLHSTQVTLVVQSNFTLTASPSSATISRGQSTSYNIAVNAVAGFNTPVTFSVTGLPAKASATFSPSSSATGTTLTVKTNPSTRPTTATLTVTGTGGGVSRTVAVTLVIQ